MHISSNRNRQILIKLAVEEPGANWANETYTHTRGASNIWGWLLPENWTREDDDMGGEGGPRRSGVLSLRYITDPVMLPSQPSTPHYHPPPTPVHPIP